MVGRCKKGIEYLTDFNYQELLSSSWEILPSVTLMPTTKVGDL